MHGLPSICSIDTDFVELFCILAKIFYVPKYMSTAILADKIAQMRPKSHICNSRFMIAPLLDRKTFEQDEALAIQYLCPNGC